MGRCTKAIIYKENLKYNLEQIRKYVNPNVKICVAVKADSYGHNAVLTAKLAEETGGFDYFAVATAEEGVELRDAGIKAEILLLSLSVPEEFGLIVKNRLTPVVFGEEYIQKLADFARENSKIDVFLAVDTGMGRIGCYENEAAVQAKLINESQNLKLAGMISHLAVSDDLSDSSAQFTASQFDCFERAVNSVRALGINPGILSCGASAGLLNNSDKSFDMVRPGIITYGYYPDQITKDYLKSVNKDFDVKPVLSLESQVVAIRRFPKGKSVSYGRTWTAPEETDIAVLPIGYADGLLRRFSPGLKVTINGKLYPVVGRICMDQCMVDIGKDNPDVKVFDRVVIFGPEESGALCTADDLAQIGGTISYEVLTSISKRVIREIK